RMFGGAYDQADPASRPVYGAPDLDGDPHSPAPRLGSAHLRLRAGAPAPSTLAHPDRTLGPVLFGVADRMGLIGEYRRNERANSGRGSAWCRDPFDPYIEAHVHGGVKVPEDVDALVIDPSFDDHTVVETAGSRGIVVETHPGYVAEI